MKNLLNLFFLLVAMMIGTTLCSCSKDDDEITETYETQHKKVYEGKQYDFVDVYYDEPSPARRCVQWEKSLPQHICSKGNNFFISFDNVHNNNYDGTSLPDIQIDTNKETKKTILSDFTEWIFSNPKQFYIKDKDREFYLEVCEITNQFQVEYCIIPKSITHTPNSFKVKAYYKLKD